MAAGRGLGHGEVKSIEDSLETSKSCHQATAPFSGLHMGKKGGGGGSKMKKEMPHKAAGKMEEKI